VPEDHPSPWSRPELASPQPDWTSPALHASAPRAPAPPLAAPSAGYGVPPVHVHVTTPATPGRGLALTGVVLAGLALLVALLTLVVVGVSGFASNPGGGYGLRGTIAPVQRGLTGPALAAEVATKISEDGGDPEGISCPATTRVDQDVTTVCHGSDYGQDATFVVFFEDATGAYTLLEI
jgi:hypothetical protein